MGVATKYLLDKIDRIRARGDQRRADRITDARTGSIATYKPASKKRVFTAEQVNNAKAQFRNNLKTISINTYEFWRFSTRNDYSDEE